MPFPIPPLFDGASTWLQTAHASLTSAAESLTPGDDDGEFRFRKQLAGLKIDLDHAAKRIQSQHGSDSDEYRAAIAKARECVDLMPLRLVKQNLDWINRSAASSPLRSVSRFARCCINCPGPTLSTSSPCNNVVFRDYEGWVAPISPGLAVAPSQHRL